LRKYLIAALIALCSTALVAATAVAALHHDMKIKATPKAGTKAKPRNVVLSAGVAMVRTAPDAQNPTVPKIDFLFPKQFKFLNSKFKKCSKAILGAQGVAGCPKGSKIGAGTALATLGAQDIPLHFKTTFFNAGPKTIVIHLQRVNEKGQPLEGSYESPTGRYTKASGKYGSRLTVSIPDSVQTPDNGSTWSKLVKLDFKLDQKYKGKTFTQSTGCKKSYPFSSTLHYRANPAPPSVSSTTTTGTVKCKK